MSKSDGAVTEGIGQDISDNSIQVFVRVRPPEKEDAAYNSQSILQVDSSSTSLTLESKPTPRQFSFDHVADIDAAQESIFNHLGRKIIENCIAGYNGTIFAYGQTGSGKTYTMLGPSEDADNLYHEQRGVIPRSFEYLYSLISRQKELQGDKIQFLCKCSFLEIYNEQIFDLMEPSAMPLHLRESLKTGVYVAGLAEKVVSDASEAYEALNSSLLNRRVASTSMNRESSRSHAIFTLQIESKEQKGAVEHIRTSQLNLVDLAGSERQKDTNATGQRLKEAGSINKSLANLGNVIMCLVTVSQTGKKRYIPYRDSKLTFLLRDSLGGNSKTTLIACVHPGHKCFGETLSTLQFAKRAKMIKNKAVLNEDAHGDIRTLQAENRALREELRQLKAGTIPREPVIGGSDENMREMFLQAMELQYKATKEKMELEKSMDQLKMAYQKRGNCLKSTKMIVKFRESTIARLEGKVKEEKEEQIAKLEKELSWLQEQLEHQQDGYGYLNENSQLKMELHRLTTASCLANIQADEKRVCMLEAKYNELRSEQDKESDEPKGTPQRCDAVSAATVEKLRSQVSSLESENNELKKSLSEEQEAGKKKEMLLTSELESYKTKAEELEHMLKMHSTLNKLEKEKINEMHLQTVKTITTPRKERYRLRNRTIIATEALTPDLDQSIPYELPEEMKENCPFDEAQDTLLEDANMALLEQIKVLQDKTSELETRISEYETDGVKQRQQQSMLESQIKQLEEMLEKSKSEKESEKAGSESLQTELKRVNIEYESARGEIRDLNIILDSTDKQLKEAKLKQKAHDTNVMSLESKVGEINVIVEQVSKQNSVLLEENEALKVEAENATETTRFLEAQVEELETTLLHKDKTIKDLEQNQQALEYAVRDEKDKLDSYMAQNMVEDNEKQNVILSKIEEITSLQSKLNVLKNEHEALESTAAMLRKELEIRDSIVVSLEKKLGNADEKINSQLSQIETLNVDCRELEQKQKSSEEKIIFLESENGHSAKKIEELKAILVAKQSEMEDKQIALEEEKRRLEAEKDGLIEENNKWIEDYNKLTGELSHIQTMLEDCQKKLKEESEKRSYPQDDKTTCTGCQIKRFRLEHPHKPFFSDIFIGDSPNEIPNSSQLENLGEMSFCPLKPRSPLSPCENINQNGVGCKLNTPKCSSPVLPSKSDSIEVNSMDFEITDS